MHRRSITSIPCWYLPTLALLLLTATLSLGASNWEGTRADFPGNPQQTELTAAQAHAVSLLLDTRPENPVPLFLCTDPNKDPDDLSVLVLVSDLQKQGFVDLRSVVTTLGDRETRTRRARLAKDVLERLGLREVEVGVGVDYSFEVEDASGPTTIRPISPRRTMRTNGCRRLAFPWWW